MQRFYYCALCILYKIKIISFSMLRRMKTVESTRGGFKLTVASISLHISQQHYALLTVTLLIKS